VENNKTMINIAEYFRASLQSIIVKLFKKSEIIIQFCLFRMQNLTMILDL